MRFKFNNLEKDYEVEISENGAGTKVVVNGKEFLFKEQEEVVAAVAQTTPPRRDLSSKEVRAALAGMISEVAVKVGDIVKMGDKLLVLSAMKMENEILAECDGKVSEVKVVKDQKVKEGEVMIVMA